MELQTQMEKLLQETDLLYFDWKVSTEEDAKKWIGRIACPDFE